MEKADVSFEWDRDAEIKKMHYRSETVSGGSNVDRARSMLVDEAGGDFLVSVRKSEDYILAKPLAKEGAGRMPVSDKI